MILHCSWNPGYSNTHALIAATQKGPSQGKGRTPGPQIKNLLANAPGPEQGVSEGAGPAWKGLPALLPVL